MLPADIQDPALPMEHDAEQPASAVVDDQATTLRVGGRKRERETSAEPHTPRSDNGEHAPNEETAERKTPATKKNRLEQLDEESPPHSPPLDHTQQAPSTPPNATSADRSPAEPTSELAGEPPKLQHIREKVKDLSWKDNGSPIRGSHLSQTTTDEPMLDATASQASAHEVPMDHQPTPISQNEDVPLPDANPFFDPSEQHEHPDIEDTNISQARPSEPPISQDFESTSTTALAAQEIVVRSNGTNTPLQPAASITSSSMPIPIRTNGPSGGHQRKNSDSDPSDPEVSKSPSRKRKLTAREPSFANESSEPHEGYSKRPRDDGSPRTIKESQDEAGPSTAGADSSTKPAVDTAVLPSSLPKPSGFAAFSGASPFAQVAGGSQSLSPPSVTSVKPAAPQPRPFSGGFGAFMSSASPFSTTASSSPSIFGSFASSSNVPARNGSPDLTSTTSRSQISNAVSPNRSRSPSVSSLNRRKSPPPNGTKPKPGAAFGSYNSSSFGFGSVPSGFGGVTNASRHSPSPSLDTGSRKGSIAEADVEDSNSDPNPQSTPEPRAASSESMKRGASWNELLGAGADTSDEDGQKDKKKLKVEEIEVLTGEENEDTLHQVRAKLFHLDAAGAFKERGLGLLKLNVRKSDGCGPRLVMRADAVHRLILNVGLFRGMVVTVGQDPKYVKLTSLENGKPSHYAIRVGNPKAAQDLHDRIVEYSERQQSSSEV
ncbi:hypothetical protein FRB99_006504 [Tulasnella sp. 403]|nr:hypothetical protein FRB99_006504 [Tulasnella sp. 403]